MFLMERRRITILPALAAALGVLLSATGGIFAASHNSKIMQVGVSLAGNPAPDGACQVVLDASDKLYTTPYHLYATETSDKVENGKPQSSEMVFAGGARYLLYNGKWTPSSISTEELKAMEERNRKNATNVSCHYVRDESVNGESVAVYTMHSETPRSKNDDEVWISKSKGLLLRQETDLIWNRNNGKTHLSSRYEYGNVQLPKL